MNYTEDKIFDRNNFREEPPEQGEYENCVFRQCDFSNTNLEKADFRTSINYSIDPANNRIKKAKFSIMGISGLLDKYDIEIENSI